MIYFKNFDSFLENYNFRPFNNEKIYDLEKDEYFHKYFYSDVNEKDISEFNSWLRKHKEDYVILYHGTSESTSKMIDNSMIKKTNSKTKRSLQSENGFVYLSVFSGHSKLFAEFGYPKEKSVIYRVYVKIKELKPDKDQLSNKRLYSGLDIKNDLGSSLIYSHGARVNRNIFLYETEKIEL